MYFSFIKIYKIKKDEKIVQFIIAQSVLHPFVSFHVVLILIHAVYTALYTVLVLLHTVCTDS